MPSLPPFFPVTYDRTTKIITAVICLVVLGIALAIMSVPVGFIGVLVIALAYAWSPRGYTVTPRAIIVKRLIGDARIALVNVREIRPASRDDFRGAIKLWGNGGLLGYYGMFRTSSLGVCHWYLTNRKKAVVLVTASQTTLFSPDDADGFVAAIRSVAPVPCASGYTG